MDATQIKLVHALHDTETLRCRYMRSIDDKAALLETARYALLKGRTEITMERIEAVLDDIRKELARLKLE